MGKFFYYNFNFRACDGSVKIFYFFLVQFWKVVLFSEFVHFFHIVQFIGIITVIILKVIECWNSYVWPRLITDDSNYFLVSNGIQEIRENGFGRDNIPAMMAAVVAVSLPLIILFLIFRNKIMEGVSREGTKG